MKAHGKRAMGSVVTVSCPLRAPADEVWRRINDIERYPKYMESVVSVTVTSATDRKREADWAVVLRGSVLKWSEVAALDHARRVVEFHQTQGDLSMFEGYWRVFGGDPVMAELSVEFEIGIPLLARMLTPVACESLEKNARAMLNAFDSEWGE